MVTAEIVEIKQQSGDGGEGKEYVVEFSLPAYSETFEAEPIPADEYDRDTAVTSVQMIAADLISSDDEVSVIFPGEDPAAASDGLERRDALRYGAGLVSIAGIAGGGWWLTNQGLAGSPGRATQPDGSLSATPLDNQSRTIDNFESGSLANAWTTGIDISTYRSGIDGGREAFTVQSTTAPQGEYALKGDRELARDGTSSILRDDFSIDQDGATLRFIVKIGPVLDGPERANKLAVIEEQSREGVITELIQKNWSESTDEALIENGTTSNSTMNSPTLVELRNIEFSNNRIGEIIVGGDTIGLNIDFLNDADEISAVWIKQGHYNQPADIVVDHLHFER